MLIVNRVEAADILGQSDSASVEAARELARFGLAVILTLGADGLIVHENGKIEAMPAHKVQAISTLGAGDAVIGALGAEIDRCTTRPVSPRPRRHLMSQAQSPSGISRETVRLFLKGQTASR